MHEGARTATATFPAPFCGNPTGRADFVTAVGEVFSVDVSMAMHAERSSVGNVKTRVRIICPGLDVMGVQLAALSACDTMKSVAGQYSGTPLSQLCGQPDTFPFKRLAVFPRICIGAGARFSRTRTGAKHRLSLMGLERHAAGRTQLSRWRITPIPTRLRTVLGVRSIGGHLKGGPTNQTGSCCPSLTRMTSKCAPARERAARLVSTEGVESYPTNFASVRVMPSLCFHGKSIPYRVNKSKYVAVTLQRMADMGLEPTLESSYREGEPPSAVAAPVHAEAPPAEG